MKAHTEGKLWDAEREVDAASTHATIGAGRVGRWVAEQAKLVRGTRLILVGNIFFTLGAAFAVVSCSLSIYLGFVDFKESTLTTPSSQSSEGAFANTSTSAASAATTAVLTNSYAAFEQAILLIDLFSAIGCVCSCVRPQHRLHHDDLLLQRIACELFFVNYFVRVRACVRVCVCACSRHS